MVEFIGGFVLGASVAALITIYYLHHPYTELESTSTVSPVSLDFWSVPSSQYDLPAPYEYLPLDAADEFKRAELVRKLAERAGQSEST